MDNLTHTLVGILVARAGLNRLAPRATLLAAIGANLPDVDIVAGLGGSLCYLAQHRGFTHALFWMPLLALAPLPLWYLLVRGSRPTRAHWLGAWLVSFCGVASHLGLDLLNVYGIRLGLPFSSRWLHLDLLHIVDVWVWVLLLAFVLAPLLGRLVSGEIGASSGPGRAGAVVGLLLLGVYIGARALLHQQALATLAARLYQGEAPMRTLALPSPANPWHWTGLVETPQAWRVLSVPLLREFDPEAAHVLFKPELAGVREAVARSATGRVFLDFSQAPVWRVLPSAGGQGGVVVQVDDLRFGLREAGAFRAEFELDRNGGVRREQFSFGALTAPRR